MWLTWLSLGLNAGLFLACLGLVQPKPIGPMIVWILLAVMNVTVLLVR